MNLQTFLWLAKAILGVARHVPAKSGLPVLIVENDLNDADLLASYVRMYGSESRIVQSLEAAEVELSQKSFRMVFLDLHFPHGCGIEFAKRIRQRFPKLPVVFVTGHVEDMNQLPSGRKWSFISKGTSGGSLMEAVQDAMLEANGVNGHTQPHLVIAVSWLISAISFALGLLFREVSHWIKP